ncbi:MAG: hypothetical protein K2X03_18470 [Bryobacteraceae bacterium]|nr:hypothetical protein [Bryobacteraceae bacterium]
MRYFILWIAATLTLLAQPSPQMCVVTIRVVDVAGKPLPHRVATFRDIRGRDFASNFTGLRGPVPCDLQYYDFTVTRSDVNNPYSNLSSRMWANQPENWITVQTSPTTIIVGDRAGAVSYRFPDNYVLRGRITPVPDDRLWIQIRSAVGPGLTETEVDETGEFRIYRGFWQGPYVLTVMNTQGKILYSSALEVENMAPSEPLSITVPADPPPALVLK